MLQTTTVSRRRSAAENPEAELEAQLIAVISRAWDEGVKAVPQELLHEVLEHVIDELDTGRLRVATRETVGHWRLNATISAVARPPLRHASSLVQKGSSCRVY